MGTAGDLPTITIYAQQVLDAAFETEPPTIDSMTVRRVEVLARCQAWLAAGERGAVLGFAQAQGLKLRPACRFCAKSSV